MKFQVLTIENLHGTTITEKSDPVDTFEAAETLRDTMMAEANSRNADLEMHITVKR